MGFKMRTQLFGAIVAACLATPALALDYVCEVRDTGDGFISPVMTFHLDPGKSTAIVYGSVIHAVHGAPIEVKLKDRGNGRYRMNYAVSNIPARPRPARMGYRVELDTVKKTILVRGSMRGADNSFNGNGHCQEGVLPKN